MQQKKLMTFLVMCLWGVPAMAVDLLADEQGPTAPEAVATVTANEDFLSATYLEPINSIPSENTPVMVPSEVDIINEIFGTSDPVSVATETVSAPIQRTFSPQTGVKCVDEIPLLTPLPPLPNITKEQVIDAKVPVFKQVNLADQALAMATSSPSGIGMPREIRITFYSGQSSFSAQALKWVKSFAIRVVNDPRLLAEIRVSEKDWKIQEKRLSVLLQILKEKGVSAHQVRIYKTDREPDTILIGYANNPAYTMVEYEKKTKERVQKTIDW